MPPLESSAGSVHRAPWLRGVGDALRTDAPLYLVLAALLLGGVLLRTHRLGDPPDLKWDEHHYVNVARSYVARQYATDDHPPLGKLIIAGVMKFTGDTPAGWRLAPLFFGFINMGLLAWVAWIVFRTGRAAALAAAFVAADGFFIAYSRTALLDGMIVAFAVAGMITILLGRSFWHVLIAGALVGAVTSFKLNGLAFVGTATVICLLRRDLRRFTPVLLAMAALVFYAQSAGALVMTGRSGSVAAVIAENRKLIQHHLSYTVVHPSSSRWYTWFLPVRPIFLRHDTDSDGSIRALITLGNPLLWWASSAAVIAAATVVIRGGWRRLWDDVRAPHAAAAPSSASAATSAGSGPGASLLAIGDRQTVLFWILAAWAAPVVFWIPSWRDSYLYHYLPSYAFALPLLAGFTDRLYQRHRLLTLIAVVIVAELTVFYAPLSGELPIDSDALNARLFKFWR